MRTIDFTVPQDLPAQNIKTFLHHFGVSGSLLKTLKNDPNGILKNGRAARTIDPLLPGDRLQINIPAEGTPPKQSAQKVRILYQDDDILVADKPPFMPVHESRNHQGDTLANAVAGELDGAFRSVYRLDRDTSGLVVVAKNSLSAAKLAGQCQKTYYAVAQGVLARPGRICLPIARMGDSIIKRCVSPRGVYAATNFVPLVCLHGRTLLQIQLETGRTHQIRVHFAHIGMPLVGDSLYGQANPQIMRQALHCGHVSLCHPVTGAHMHFYTAFPPEFMICMRGE